MKFSNTYKKKSHRLSEQTSKHSYEWEKIIKSLYYNGFPYGLVPSYLTTCEQTLWSSKLWREQFSDKKQMRLVAEQYNFHCH